MRHVSDRFYTVFFLIIFLFAFSCTKSENNRFDVSESSLSFQYRGGEKGIIVNSSCAWTIVASEPWCKAMPSSGSCTLESGASVVLVCAENNGEERSCTITVSNGSEEKVVSVIQGHSDQALILPVSTFFAAGSQEQVTVDFISDTAVEAVSDSPWLTVSSIDSKFGHICLAMIPMDNDTELRRIGKVSISNKFETKTISVIQGEGPLGSELVNCLLVKYDINHDGFLSRNEAETITDMVIGSLYPYANDTDIMTGFDYFPNLRSLTINRAIGDNLQLTVSFKGLSKLESISIGSAALIDRLEIDDCPCLRSVSGKIQYPTSITVTNCPMLESLSFGQISPSSPETSVRIANCANIRKIYLYMDSCSALNISDLQNLTTFGLRINHGYIKCIDLHESVNLKTVQLSAWKGRFYSLLLNEKVKDGCDVQYGSLLNEKRGIRIYYQ